MIGAEEDALSLLSTRGASVKAPAVCLQNYWCHCQSPRLFSDLPLVGVTMAPIAAAFSLLTAHIPVMCSLNFTVLKEISIVL